MANGKAGRPRMFDTAEALQTAIDGYFDYCDNRMVDVEVEDKEGNIQCIQMNKPEPYTWPGLASFIGFEDRHSLWAYGKHETFSHTIKKAKTRIEAQRNVQMLEGKVKAVPAIFDLKNNFGWKDKQEIDVSSDMNVTFEGGDV